MELIDEINEAMLQDDQIPDLGPLALMGLANATDLLVNITVGQMLRETDNVMRNDDPMLLLNEVVNLYTQRLARGMYGPAEKVKASAYQSQK